MMQTQFVLDFWLKDLSTYQILVEKRFISERYDFSKTIYKFYQQIGFVKKQVQL